MSTAQRFIKELQQEATKNRAMLERIPEPRLSWKPHDKSMTLGRLGMHIAELPRWVDRCLNSKEFDMGTGPYNPNIPKTHAEIMAEFDRQLLSAVKNLESATDAMLEEQWKFRRGDLVIYDLPRGEVIRRQLNHIIHHRGQLSVFLRLLDVPVPGTYGPSADER
jgi:uncharacterized damage-inducible protein DinB